MKLHTNNNNPRPYIDLNLGGKSFITNKNLDEVIEAKIKQVAEELVRKSHLDLNTKLTQRTKQIREYIDQQATHNINEKRNSLNESGSFGHSDNLSMKSL